MTARARPLIAFFDYPDVFEDFYPHYGVTQQAFATKWAATGNHAFVTLLQRQIGDVVWYETSLKPEVDEARHEIGCVVRFVRSSWLHRCAWTAFYRPRMAWRWRWAYPLYAVLASYAAPLSLPLLRTLLRDRPDAFVVQEYSSGRFDALLLTARLLGVPLIARHAGGRPERYIGKFAKRWTIRRAEALLVSSRQEADMLATRFGVSRARMQVVLTPTDTERFRPIERDDACRMAGLDPSRRWLLFVGRLDDRVKRIGALMGAFERAAARHPNASLLIVGDGPDAEVLRRHTDRMGGERVSFLGWRTGPAELAPLYNAAECLLLPSRSEGFPSVVGEAMACGTPVLSSRVGGVPELVIEGKTGWLVAPGDDGALQEKVAWVLDHPEATRAMRSSVREIAVFRVSPAGVAVALRDCFRIAGVRNMSHDPGDERAVTVPKEA